MFKKEYEVFIIRGVDIVFCSFLEMFFLVLVNSYERRSKRRK